MLKVRRGNTLAGIYEMVYRIIITKHKVQFSLYMYINYYNIVTHVFPDSSVMYDRGLQVSDVSIFLSSQKSALVKDGCIVMDITKLNKKRNLTHTFFSNISKNTYPIKMNFISK